MSNLTWEPRSLESLLEVDENFNYLHIQPEKFDDIKISSNNKSNEKICVAVKKKKVSNSKRAKSIPEVIKSPIKVQMTVEGIQSVDYLMSPKKENLTKCADLAEKSDRLLLESRWFRQSKLSSLLQSSANKSSNISSDLGFERSASLDFESTQAIGEVGNCDFDVIVESEQLVPPIKSQYVQTKTY
ncbi:CLUMA_CG014971, isoform A [Clunio marinus]|uniref:CLUMA_CG014971, isoform A n=1 Tax=Clunio marinus TaxID=568069 RepID=A0A1J1INF6_9DIPT|nr:CLUMA_CG014971, isoform A [Clunio marinus]